MRKFQMWVLTLGLVAATSTNASADIFSFMKKKNKTKSSISKRTRATRSRSTASKAYNQKVANDIGKALRTAKLNGYEMEVSFENGMATLKGKIADLHQKIKATAVVKSVSGVKKVSNQLVALNRSLSPSPVTNIAELMPSNKPIQKTSMQKPQTVTSPIPPMPNRKTGRSMAKTSGREIQSNQKIANEIGQALRAAKLNGYEMEVSFENGMATLKGKIADLRKKIKATAVVKSVSGVKKVNNQLVALNRSLSPSPVTNIAEMRTSNKKPIQKASMRKPEMVRTKTSGSEIQTNQKIANAIAKKLSKAGVEGDIEISYQNGMAMLKGPTTSIKQKAMAEKITRSVPGVMMVNNQLKVEGMTNAMASRQPNAPQMAMPAMYQAQNGQAPAQFAHPGAGAQKMVYNNPSLPEHAWPSYAAYPNYAQVAYPKQYSPSAWPYIGPFYPYPQVPMGWRNVKLEWDDGMWSLNFNPKTDRWWWFLSPKNW